MIRLASNPQKPDATYNRVGGSMPDVVASLVCDFPRKNNRRIYLIENPMYKVTIQRTLAGESNWRVVTTGTWNQGEPQLADGTLPIDVVEALFKVTHSAWIKQDGTKCKTAICSTPWCSGNFRGSPKRERPVREL
jgi:hypothetical protein